MAAPLTLVGVDLGGTNIRAGVADAKGGVGAHAKRATPADEGPEAVIEAIAETVRDACGGAPPDGVAVGIPGPLDPDTGIVFAAPHLRGWTGVNARDMLAHRVGAPVAVHNDASLAGYAEWISGAGMGTRHMVFVTASTGIGGALVVNGELVSGFAGTAGEIGHIPLGFDAPECGQGHRGCLEGTASGTAIANRARTAIADGVATSLRDVDPTTLNAVSVEDAAKAGDVLSIQLWHDAGRALGRSIGGLINMLSPEVVVIGGGLINAGNLLFEPLHAGVHEIAFDVPASRCRIVEAGLGTDAGLVGAVAWAVRSFGADASR